MAQLVEEGLGRVVGDRAHRDGPAFGVALDVAVDEGEWDAPNVEGRERPVSVPLGNLDLAGERRPLGLLEDEPARLPDEDRFHASRVARSSGSGSAVVVAPADGDRHAEGERLLAGLHLPAEVVPALEGGDRAGRETAHPALEDRRKLIAEAVAVESAVGLEDGAGAADCLGEELRPVRSEA